MLLIFTSCSFSSDVKTIKPMVDAADVILLAGKGHEDYIVVGNKQHWFDDRAEARDALRKIVTVQESGVDTTNLPWGRVGAIAGNGNMLDA